MTIQSAEFCSRCKCMVSWTQVRNAFIQEAPLRRLFPKMNLKGKDVQKRNKGGGKILDKSTSRQESSESRAWSWRKHEPLWWLCPGWKGSTVRPYLPMVQSGMSGMLLNEEKGGLWYISASLHRLVCASHLGNLETGNKRSGVASRLGRYVEKTCCYCKYHVLVLLLLLSQVSRVRLCATP